MRAAGRSRESWRFTALIALAVQILGVGVAEAQGYYDSAVEAGRGRGVAPGYFYGDLGFAFKEEPGGRDVLAFAPTLHAMIPVGRRKTLGIGFDWGVVVSHIDPSVQASETEAFLQNLFVGVSWFKRLGSGRLEVGGGLALPLALTTNRFGQVQAGLLGGGLNGLWEPWRFFDALGTAATLRVYYPTRPGVFFAADFGLGLLFELPDTTMTDGADLVLQFAGDVGYDSGTFAFGLRLQGVWIPTTDVFAGDDEFQFSLAPFVQFGPDDVFFRLALFMNIDQPFGFAFDDAGIYGLWSAVGTSF